MNEYTYSKFLNTDSTKIRLETSDFESSSYEQQLEWQGFIFEKGIGLTSRGGASLSMELVEYRIGTDGQRRVVKK